LFYDRFLEFVSRKTYHCIWNRGLYQNLSKNHLLPCHCIILVAPFYITDSWRWNPFEKLMISSNWLHLINFKSNKSLKILVQSFLKKEFENSGPPPSYRYAHIVKKLNGQLSDQLSYFFKITGSILNYCFKI